LMALWPNPSFPFFKPRVKKDRVAGDRKGKRPAPQELQEENSETYDTASKTDKDGRRGPTTSKSRSLRPRRLKDSAPNQHNFHKDCGEASSGDDSEQSVWDAEDLWFEMCLFPNEGHCIWIWKLFESALLGFSLGSLNSINGAKLWLLIK
jgi:hypothetical protein